MRLEDIDASEILAAIVENFTTEQKEKFDRLLEIDRNGGNFDASDEEELILFAMRIGELGDYIEVHNFDEDILVEAPNMLWAMGKQFYRNERLEDDEQDFEKTGQELWESIVNECPFFYFFDNKGFVFMDAFNTNQFDYDFYSDIEDYCEQRGIKLEEAE